MQLNLTRSEAQIILNAIAATCKSGGGSAHYTLQRYLEAQFSLTPEIERVIELQATAHREYAGKD